MSYLDDLMRSQTAYMADARALSNRLAGFGLDAAKPSTSGSVDLESSINSWLHKVVCLKDRADAYEYCGMPVPSEIIKDLGEAKEKVIELYKLQRKELLEQKRRQMEELATKEQKREKLQKEIDELEAEVDATVEGYREKR